MKMLERSLADVVKSGRIEVGKEFSASYVSLTHTVFFANPFYPTLVDELRLRGLAVTFGHLLHGHARAIGQVVLTLTFEGFTV
jgi:hypothetical protein